MKRNLIARRRYVVCKFVSHYSLHWLNDGSRFVANLVFRRGDSHTFSLPCKCANISHLNSLRCIDNREVVN